MVDYLVLSLLYGLPLYCILRTHSSMSREDSSIVAGLMGLGHGFLLDPYENIPLFAAFFNLYTAYGTIMGVLMIFEWFGQDKEDDEPDLNVSSEQKNNDSTDPSNLLE